MATTLKKVPALVASHSAFNANGSLFAKIVGPFYAVYSYGEHFPVAIRQRTNDDALRYGVQTPSGNEVLVGSYTQADALATHMKAEYDQGLRH